MTLFLFHVYPSGCNGTARAMGELDLPFTNYLCTYSLHCFFEGHIPFSTKCVCVTYQSVLEYSIERMLP